MQQKSVAFDERVVGRSKAIQVGEKSSETGQTIVSGIAPSWRSV
jgi:hypothetical protein